MRDELFIASGALIMGSHRTAVGALRPYAIPPTRSTSPTRGASGPTLPSHLGQPLDGFCTAGQMALQPGFGAKRGDELRMQSHYQMNDDNN